MVMNLCRLLFCLIVCSSLKAEVEKYGNGFIPGHIRVNQIAMVGAHNISISSKDGWVYSQQSEKVSTLLNKHGVRFMKIPLHWFLNSKKQTSISLCHEAGKPQNCKLSKLQRKGKDPKRAKELLYWVASFADGNPNEVIIIKFESYLFDKNINHKVNGTLAYTDDYAVTKLDKLIKDSGLGNRVYKLKVGKKWPKLEKLRKIGKNVIILEQGDKSGKLLQAKSHYVSSFRNFMAQTHWSDNHRDNCQLYGPKHKFLEIAINYELSIQKGSVKGFVAKALKAVPQLKKVKTYDYSSVNGEAKVTQRLGKCQKNHNFAGFVLSSDHVHKGNIKEIVRKHNLRLR